MNSLDTIFALVTLQQRQARWRPENEDAFYERYAGTRWTAVFRRLSNARKAGLARWRKRCMRIWRDG